MIPKDSNVSKQIQGILRKEAQNAQHKMLPLHEENAVYNFYLKVGNHGAVAPLEEKPLKDYAKSDLVKMVEALRRAGAPSQGGPRQPGA